MRFILEIIGLFINILIVTVDLLSVFRPLCHSPWLIVILFLFVLIIYFNYKFFIHECGIIRPDSNFIHTPFMLWDWLSDYFIWFYLWKNRGTCNYLPKKMFYYNYKVNFTWTQIMIVFWTMIYTYICSFVYLFWERIVLLIIYFKFGKYIYLWSLKTLKTWGTDIYDT